VFGLSLLLLISDRLQVGSYDPLPWSQDAAKEVRLRVDRIKYWLSVGVQPSPRVHYLLWRAGVVDTAPVAKYLNPEFIGVPKKERGSGAYRSSKGK
jgi:small subunit ribosomal protein S16